ncbi:PAS domain-containing sensor histidine kinase [Rhodopseudomonas sp.]|uniref:PAS domain-containing sensor histidine kinase n=1 Tax=Rhodopseudomonas sp. TaxID=1078 RepID=UPI0025E554D2|nr:PAS domain-containing sensor histidine kinase [Rhodopseudomonas sp.]
MSSTNRQSGGGGQRHLTIPASLVSTFMYSSSDCMATLDAVGVIQHANPTWRAAMEVTSDAELDGLNWQDLWPTDMRAEAVKAIERAHARLTTRFTARCQSLKGQLRWFDLTVGPVTDVSGNLAQILVQSRDVTSYKLRESDLQNSVTATEAALGALTRELQSESHRLAQATARAAHAEKIRLLGQFVGNIVHDFNNVLMVLSSSSRILHRGVAPKLQADILDNIDQAIERGRLLVRHLLELLRIEATEPELIDTPEFVDATATLAGQLFGGTITLGLDVEPACWPVRASPSKLRAVFLNLLSHAVATMSDGGMVTVRVKNCRDSELPPTLPPGDYVHFAVCDMRPEVPLNPPAQFNATVAGEDKPDSAAGAELAGAFELAEHCHGKVIVWCTPGAGTSVNLYLPRAAAGPTAAARRDDCGGQ